MTRRRREGVEASEDKGLPANLEAERAVLGAVLNYNDTYLKAARYIRSSNEFFRMAHAFVWESLVALLEKPNGTADIVSVKNHLASRNLLDEVGGPAYIANLVDGVPRSTNVAEYAGIVREKARLRNLIALGNKVVSRSYDAEETSDAIVRATDAEILTMHHGQSDGRMQSTRHSASGLLDYLQERFEKRGTVIGVPTGFQRVDDLTLGWQRGDMVIAAARPSIGKTAFILSQAVSAAESMRADGQARHAAIFSLEMKRISLECRLLSMVSGVPLSSIQSGYLFEQHWGPLTAAIGRLTELNLHIDDTAHRTMGDIRAECRRLLSEHGLDLVIIDYLQLVTTTIPKAPRAEQVADISRKIKLLADELSVPVIALSQLSRAGSQRGPDARPQLSDLRESGALEQDADTVLFLHRKDHRVSGRTELIFDKQRNGSTGTVYMDFDRDIQRFTEMSDQTAPVEAPPKEKKTPDQWAKLKAIQKQRAKQKKDD